MLVHQWADQYRSDAMWHGLAKALLVGCEFFDCGDPDDFTIAGDDLWQAARPPFPNTVVQFDFQKDGHRLVTLVFVRQSGADEFVVFEGVRDANGQWWTSRKFIWARTTSGGWGICGDANHKMLGDRSYEDESVHREVVGNAVSLAWSVFAVMACSNVRAQEHKPAEALNKKRTKAGKLPLVSYKTLEIIAPGERCEKPTAGGTHASPRVHLRRGHIRMLGDRRTVWVQACVVGSKHGMVVKDYRVRPAHLHNANSTPKTAQTKCS